MWFKEYLKLMCTVGYNYIPSRWKTVFWGYRCRTVFMTDWQVQRWTCALQIVTTAVATFRSNGLECSRGSIFVYIDRFELYFEQKN